MNFPVILLLAVLPFGIGLVWMMFRLTRLGENAVVSLEWLEEFSIEKYLLMERLLYEGDYEFLVSQPGYAPSIGRRLRAERRRIFRGYLHQINRDFNRLVALAKLMIVHGSEDQAHLAAALWRQRWNFYSTIFTVECRLALAPTGMRVTGVTALVEALGGVQASVMSLVPTELMARPVPLAN